MEIIYTNNEVKNLGGEPAATTLLNVRYFISDVVVNKKKVMESKSLSYYFH